MREAQSAAPCAALTWCRSSTMASTQGAVHGHGAAEAQNLAQRIKRVKRLTPADTARSCRTSPRYHRAHEAGIVPATSPKRFLVKNETKNRQMLDFGVAKIERHALEEGTRTRTAPFWVRRSTEPEQAQGTARYIRARTCGQWRDCVRVLDRQAPFYGDPGRFGSWHLRARHSAAVSIVQCTHRSTPGGTAPCARPQKRFQPARVTERRARDALGLEPREFRATCCVPPPKSRSPRTRRARPRATHRRPIRCQACTSRPCSRTRPSACASTSWRSRTPRPWSPRRPAKSRAHRAAVHTTQKSPSVGGSPAPTARLVIGVAAAALFVGLLRLMRCGGQRDDDADQPRALPAPSRVAAPPSEPRVKATHRPRPPLSENRCSSSCPDAPQRLRFRRARRAAARPEVKRRRRPPAAHRSRRPPPARRTPSGRPPGRFPMATPVALPLGVTGLILTVLRERP